jgi:site-specific DNA-methyltransferase (adenine-specific)
MEADDITLLRGDCLKLLADLPDGSVDALVTDPPFGIGFKYGSTREVAADPESYWKWLEPIFDEATRCVRPGGLIAIWQAALNFRYFWNWFGDSIHIYAACKNFVQLRKTPINYGFDPVVMFYKDCEDGLSALCPRKPRRSIDFFVSNTAAIISDTSRPEKGHPCPRPLDVVEAIVSNFSRTDATILDPFMGSGTTGVACVNTGRKFIGIELDSGYFKIAEKRIAAAQAARAELLIPANV